MSEESANLKWKVAAWAVATCVAYVGLSSPGKVVTNDRGKITGLINQARESLQGKGFWKDQLRFVRKEFAWEQGAPARDAKFKQETRQLEAKIDRDMRELYREYPDMRPTRAEAQAEALRERADAIEIAQFERELETMRRARIAELQRIEKFLTAEIK